MLHRWFVLMGCGFLTLLALANLARAQDAKTPPGGLRVQNHGNSWGYSFNRIRLLETAAEIKPAVFLHHAEVIDGKPAPIYTPGCLGDKIKRTRECATLKAKLEAGSIDVFTYTHSNWGDTPIAEEFAEFAYKHNPNFRVLWQAGWMVHDGLGIDKNGPARDAVTIADLQAALDKARKRVEAKADEINKKLGKKVVFLVPVGDAFVKLRTMVVDGKFPGVTKQSELFNDDMPHQGRLGSILQDYCTFASLYQRSPVGLNVSLDKAVTDEQHAILQRIAWETVSKSATTGISRHPGELTNSIGMRLASIPPGKFLMGSPVSEVGRESQETQHEVELTREFYLGMHEVTVGQFKQFVQAEKYQTDGEKDGKGAYGIDESGKIEQMNPKFTWKSPGFEQTDDHPVVDVSWNDAKAFCLWLSKKEKKSYRLPTEAEWEYACRAGTKTAYVHGDDPEILATVGNGADATARAKYPGWSIGIQGKDGHIFTAPVGQFKANAFGLYDMHGSVWEWCEDWYEPNSYPKEKQIDPTGPATGKAKVQRGGGWSSDAKRLRSAVRVGRDHSAYRGCYLGFRVALVQASAEVPKGSGAAAEKTAGGRVAYMLLVNGAVTDAVVKSANIEGNKSVASPYVGTWHSFVKGMDQIQKGRLDPVERGDIDVMMIGTLLSYPQAEAWKNHLGTDDSTMAGIAALGIKNNPKFRICWQTYIWPVGQERKDGTKTLDVAATKKRAANEPLKELEKLVDAINEKHSRKVVLISPGRLVGRI